MSSYLEPDALKAYLRIVDTVDDVLIGQVCDAVEAEQRARCSPATFSDAAFTATPDPSGLTVTFAIYGHGGGPFRWEYGDGVERTTAAGITTTAHTYTAGTYDVDVEDDPAGTQLVALVALEIPAVAPTSVPGGPVRVPDDVYLAALMRGSRLYARRASPEGLVGLGELGVARVPPYDRDIDALESPWRNVVLA